MTTRMKKMKKFLSFFLSSAIHLYNRHFLCELRFETKTVFSKLLKKLIRFNIKNLFFRNEFLIKKKFFTLLSVDQQKVSKNMLSFASIIFFNGNKYLENSTFFQILYEIFSFFRIVRARHFLNC